MNRIQNLLTGFAFFALTPGQYHCTAGYQTKGLSRDGDSTVVIAGKPLPQWQEGYLDIHAINTGRGESTFFIFPDGTTALVDGAGSPITDDNAFPAPPQKPDPNTSPGTAITNYIRHFHPAISGDSAITYGMVSHFHGDHMGGFRDDTPLSADGTFKMTGISEVGSKMKFKFLLDRDYPDYNYPIDLRKRADAANYIRFTSWTRQRQGTEVEQFRVGSNRQIRLRIKPRAYPQFEVRNIVGNGRVWNGMDTGSVNTFPENKAELLAADPNENIFSIGFLLTYGAFNYFTAGDLQYDGRAIHSWKDIEAPVSKVVGQVDVLKANHHGTSNTNGTEFLNSLKPRVTVIHVWRNVQPNPETVDRLIAANDSAQLFLTNLDKSNRGRISDYLPKIKSTQGHIVIRVSPGGNEFNIFILDDSNERYIVKEIFGPFKSN